MKKHLIAAMILAGLFQTANAADYFDDATVIGSEPIYTNQQQQDCHNETVQGQNQPQQHDRGYMGAGVGAVAGGILGNQVGNGNGRTVATAAGAVIGALAGDRIQNDGATGQGQTQPQVQQVCTNRNVSVVSGYKVRYSYLGRVGQTVTRQQPGNTIRVGITAM